jgi:hypothetical protein
MAGVDLTNIARRNSRTNRKMVNRSRNLGHPSDTAMPEFSLVAELAQGCPKRGTRNFN